MNKVKIFFNNRKKEFYNREFVRLNDRCFVNYIWNRLILRRKEWKICFKGKYMCGFYKRAKEWVDYYIACLYINILNKDSLVKPMEPCYIKISNTPREDFLERILESFGIEIIEEKILPVDTIYIVKVK